MMTIIAALFTSGALKWIGIGIAGIVAVGGAWLHGKSTGAKQATDADAGKVAASAATATVAKQQAAEAQADAQTAKETTAAVQVAAQAQTDAQSMTSDELDAEAAKLGILRKD